MRTAREWAEKREKNVRWMQRVWMGWKEWMRLQRAERVHAHREEIDRGQRNDEEAPQAGGSERYNLRRRAGDQETDGRKRARVMGGAADMLMDADETQQEQRQETGRRQQESAGGAAGQGGECAYSLRKRKSALREHEGEATRSKRVHTQLQCGMRVSDMEGLDSDADTGVACRAGAERASARKRAREEVGGDDRGQGSVRRMLAGEGAHREPRSDKFTEGGVLRTRWAKLRMFIISSTNRGKLYGKNRRNTRIGNRGRATRASRGNGRAHGNIWRSWHTTKRRAGWFL